MYNIKLNGQNKTITLRKVQRDIKLYQTGRQGPQGPPGTTSGPQTYSQFVYNSSTTQEDNRYSVWQDLVDAINDGQGGTVTISFEQSETIPAGEYNLPNVKWAGNGIPVTVGGLIVTFAEGAMLTPTPNFTIDNALAIRNVGSEPVMIVDNGFRLEMDNASYLGAADAPFFRFTDSSAPTITLGLGSVITNGSGAAPIELLDNTQAAVVISKPFADINDDTVKGDATASVFVIVGVDALAYPTDIRDLSFPDFAGTLGVQIAPHAKYSTYDPTASGLTADNVQAALDEIVADMPPPSTAIVESVVAGDRITVDDTDPANPVVTADIQPGLEFADFVDSDSIDFIEAPNPADPHNIGVVVPTVVTTLTSGSQRKGVSKFTADKGGKLISYHVNSLVNSGTSKVKALVYSDNAGDPDALLALSDEITINNTTLQINNLTFSGGQQITINEGTDYWIGYINEPSGGNTFGISTNNAPNGIYRTSDTYSDGPTNPFGTPTIENGVIDGYMTIEANGISAEIDPSVQTDIDSKLPITSYDDATASETNTGTSTSKYVSPDGLAGSYAGTKVASVYVIEAATVVTTGDGKAYIRINSDLNGMNLVSVSAAVITTSSSGLPTVQLARGRQSSASEAHTFADMLSTKVTIDATEYDSKDATTAAVIDTANDDVATGDLIRIDVDVAGTGTAGLIVTMAFRLP